MDSNGIGRVASVGRAGAPRRPPKTFGAAWRLEPREFDSCISRRWDSLVFASRPLRVFSHWENSSLHTRLALNEPFEIAQILLHRSEEHTSELQSHSDLV